ncbi:hypothetical protein BDR26DRAFT_870595, partial [Obelidium mucronatum]
MIKSASNMPKTVGELLADGALSGFMEMVPPSLQSRLQELQSIPWVRRFFVLSETSLYMFPTSAPAEFVIDCMVLSASTSVSPTLHFLPDYPLGLMISNTNSYLGMQKSWILLASNKTAKNSWIASINAACESVRSAGDRAVATDRAVAAPNSSPPFRPPRLQRGASTIASRAMQNNIQELSHQMEQSRLGTCPSQQQQQQQDTGSERSLDYPETPPQMSRDTWSSSRSSQSSKTPLQTTPKSEYLPGPSIAGKEPLSYSDFANGRSKSSGPPVGSMAGPYRSIKKKKSNKDQAAELEKEAKTTAKAKI